MTRPGIAAAVDIRHATPADAEQIADLYHDVYDGAYPIAESTDPALIRRTLVDAGQVWLLAVHDGTVVGSVQARPDTIGEAYEICGWAVRNPGRGLGAVLLDAGVRVATNRAGCELGGGYFRGELSRHLALHLFRWVGTDGGMHRVGADREEHLVGVRFNAERLPIRVLPAASVLRAGSEVAHAVAATRLETRRGPYPARIAAGRPG